MRTPLDLLEDGESIFLDSNFFIYIATKHPQHYESCKSLLNRIEIGRVRGVTSITVLGELFHHIAMMAVARRFRTSDPSRYAKENPNIWRGLSEPYGALNEIRKLQNIQIMDESLSLFENAVSITEKNGLMLADAKIVAACVEGGVHNIATADADFERANLKVWAP